MYSCDCFRGFIFHHCDATLEFTSSSPLGIPGTRSFALRHVGAFLVAADVNGTASKYDGLDALATKEPASVLLLILCERMLKHIPSLKSGSIV